MKYEIYSQNLPGHFSSYGVTYAHRSSAVRAAKSLMAAAASVGIHMHRLAVRPVEAPS